MNQRPSTPTLRTSSGFVFTILIGWFFWTLAACGLFGLPSIWQPEGLIVCLLATIPYGLLALAAWREAKRIHQLDADLRGAIWIGKTVWVFGAISFVLFLYGFALFGYQVLYWLQTNTWVSCSLYDSLMPAWPNLLGPANWLPHDMASKKFALWLVSPSAWLGFHNLLEAILLWLPFSIVTMTLAAANLALMIHIDEARLNAEKKLEGMTVIPSV